MMKNLLFVICAFLSISATDWKIGAKIHFEECSGSDYLGTIQINNLVRAVLRETFDVKSDSCADQAKILIKQENGVFILKHYEERSKPGIGEEMHATLIYTSKRTEDGHDTLKDVCSHLAEIDKTLTCVEAPSLEHIAKIYQGIFKTEWKFEITDVVLWTSPVSHVIAVKLQFEGRDEILNENGHPISAKHLHMTLINIDPSVVSEIDKLRRVVSKLKEILLGKSIKVGERNGQADLEFGVSGSPHRIRP